MTASRTTDTDAAHAAYSRVVAALAAAHTHQARIIRTADGWPTGGTDGGRSSDTTSTTERTALAHLDDGHEVGRAVLAITEIREWFTDWDTNMADAARMIAQLTHRPHLPDDIHVSLDDVGPPLERIAQANRALQTSEGRSVVEDCRDWWTSVRKQLAAGAKLAAAWTPKTERKPPVLCDSTGLEGAALAWVPFSRAHDNGWADPLCVDIADSSGLCHACAQRERTFRREHGLQPRNRNRAQDAA